MKTALNSEWRHRLGEANALLQAGRPDDARALVEPHLDEPDAPAQAHALAGMIAHAAGDARAAAGHLERAVVATPGDADLRYNLGALYRECGRLEAAERTLRQVLDAEPGHAPSAAQLADLLNTAGRYREAAAVCRACLEGGATEPAVLLALADANRLDADLAGAAEALEEAARRWPGDARVLARLGLLRRSQGRPDAAIDCYRAALALRPGHPPTLNNLGLALLAQGRLEEARECFEAALARAPGFADARLNRSALLARQHRREEALEEARAAAADAPGLGRAHSAVAALLSGERDPGLLAEAEQSARRALELDPDDAVAWDALGLVLMKRGAGEAAFEAGEQAARLAPGALEYWLHLADNLARDGQLDRARDVLRRALEHHPEAPEVHRQLGILLLRLDLLEEAHNSLERCLRVRPRDQRAIAHEALVLQRLGRMEEAATLLGLDRFIRRVRIEDVRPFDSVEAFNRQLAADIRRHPGLRWEPVGLAASGGALTGELLEAPTEAIRVFERELRRAIDALRASLESDPSHPFLRRIPARYRLNTWATLVPEQGEISSHIHEESWLSGAYYAELPAAMGARRCERAGWLEFGRPSNDLPGVPDAALRWVEPEEGLLLLFPSYLFHRTLPFRGEGERISLSFDLEPVEGEQG